jgi:hypothetical protein
LAAREAAGFGRVVVSERIQQRFDDGLLGERFRLQAVAGHARAKQVRPGASAQDSFERVVVDLLAEGRDGGVDGFYEPFSALFVYGRFERFFDELGRGGPRRFGWHDM